MEIPGLESSFARHGESPGRPPQAVPRACGFIAFPVLFSIGVRLTSANHASMILAALPIFTGGIAMAWYLPFVLLTVFRPNLEDRVALNVVELGPRSRRRYARQLTSLAESRSST